MCSAALSPPHLAANYTKLKLSDIVKIGNMAEIQKYQPNGKQQINGVQDGTLP
jgi:hypothetical protein